MNEKQSRYKKTKTVLGEGSYKTVTKALDEEEGKEVAYNEVRIRRYETETNAKTSFSKEIALLKTIDHKNILKILDYWFSEDNFIFITEFMTGGTLGNYIDVNGTIGIKLVKKWGKQILEGLCYLHHQNPPIIHRDIKNDNIFVNAATGEVKIGDLGLARERRNKRYTVVGTPNFMAREIFENEGYTEKVDVYAFGICLLEMTTGERAYFEFSDNKDIYKNVIQGALPKSIHTITDPCLKSLIISCLVPTNNRFTSTQCLNHHFFNTELICNGTCVPAEFVTVYPVVYEQIKNMELSIVSIAENTVSFQLLIFKSIKFIKFDYHLESDTIEGVCEELINENILQERAVTDFSILLNKGLEIVHKKTREGQAHDGIIELTQNEVELMKCRDIIITNKKSDISMNSNANRVDSSKTSDSEITLTDSSNSSNNTQINLSSNSSNNTPINSSSNSSNNTPINSSSNNNSYLYNAANNICDSLNNNSSVISLIDNTIITPIDSFNDINPVINNSNPAISNLTNINLNYDENSETVNLNIVKNFASKNDEIAAEFALIDQKMKEYELKQEQERAKLEEFEFATNRNNMLTNVKDNNLKSKEEVIKDNLNKTGLFDSSIDDCCNVNKTLVRADLPIDIEIELDMLNLIDNNRDFTKSNKLIYRNNESLGKEKTLLNATSCDLKDYEENTNSHKSILETNHVQAVSNETINFPANEVVRGQKAITKNNFLTNSDISSPTSINCNLPNSMEDKLLNPSISIDSNEANFKIDYTVSSSQVGNNNFDEKSRNVNSSTFNFNDDSMSCEVELSKSVKFKNVTTKKNEIFDQTVYSQTPNTSYNLAEYTFTSNTTMPQQLNEISNKMDSISINNCSDKLALVSSPPFQTDKITEEQAVNDINLNESYEAAMVKYRNNHPITQFVMDSATITNRTEDTAKSWLKVLKEEHIETVFDLKLLTYEDWEKLPLTVFSCRAMQNMLYGIDGTPVKEKQLLLNPRIKEYENTIKIKEFLEDLCDFIHRKTLVSILTDRLLAEDIQTVGELKSLHQDDWNRLGLTVFGFRILKNTIYRKGKISIEDFQ